MGNYTTAVSAMGQQRGRNSPASLLCAVHGRRPLTRLLSQLASDFLIPAWADVEALVGSDAADHAQYADVFNAIYQYHGFLAAAAFRLPDVHRLLISGGVAHPEWIAPWLTVPLPAWAKAITRCQVMWNTLLGDAGDSVQAALYIEDRLRMLREAVPALTIMMDWVQFCHGGDMPASIIEVALAQSKSPSHLTDALWVGDDSLLQSLLLRTHHPDQVWPASMIYQQALGAFIKRAPEEIAGLVDPTKIESGHGIFWASVNDHQAAVVNLPVLLGFWTMTGVGTNWWGEPRRLRQFLDIYAFDPIWFNAAYNQGAKIALAYGFQSRCAGGGL